MLSLKSFNPDIAITFAISLLFCFYTASDKTFCAQRTIKYACAKKSCLSCLKAKFLRFSSKSIAISGLENEKGFATYIALGVIFVLIALGTGISVIVNNELTLVGHGSDRNKAYYLAEAGINHAVWKLNQTTSPGGVVSGSFSDGGSYSTEYSGKTLTSTGVFNNVTRKIIVNTIESTAPSAFDVGLFGGNAPTNGIIVLQNVVIWNDLTASNDKNKVVLENYNSSNARLNIYGDILNKPEAFSNNPPTPTDSPPHINPVREDERHAVVYARNAMNFLTTASPPAVSEGRIGTSRSGYSPPSFNTTAYDSKIASTTTSGSTIWSSNRTLSAGPIYINGNLTINNGARITTNSSVTKTNPAEVVVGGYVYINGATINGTIIGNATDPSYINIMSRRNMYFNSSGTNPLPVYLKKETQYYSQSNIYVYDNVRMEQASIFAGATARVQSRYNLTANPDINLRGIIFGKTAVYFYSTTSTSGTIAFDGGAVAGYTNTLGNVVNGSIYFSTYAVSGRRIEITSSSTAKPSQMPSVFQIPITIQPDYNTWREN